VAANSVWDEIKKVNPSQNDIVADFPVSGVQSAAPSGEQMPGGQHPAAVPGDTPTDDHMAEAESGDHDIAGLPESQGDEDAAASVSPGDQTYTVKAGDTLGSISEKFYGDSSEYMRIFDANRDQLANRNVIEVGQELQIPER
jgi:nucleoid-associated protein YgaU